MIWAIISFIFGLIVGSFLNVVILRLKKGEDIVLKPSHCVHCKHRLSFFDLIPLLSFLFLRGKCRYCGKKISWQYPLVEFFTGVLFVISYLIFWPNVLSIIFYCAIFSVFLVVFVFDLKYFLISEEVLLWGGAITLIFRVWHYLNQGNFSWMGLKDFLWPYVLGGALFALPLFLIFWWTKEKAMGFGDVELAMFLGFVIGYQMVLINLLIASLSGSIIGLGLVALGKKEMKSQLPFGPFLVVGAFLAIIYGTNILNWYLSIL